MKDELSPIEEVLECPVCLTVPREGPLPSCPAGHIVCKSCESYLNHAECPTCRRPMLLGYANYPLSELIEKVRHFCKYKHLGCETKEFLVDLESHEKECVHRKIQCPQVNCRKLVTLSKFSDHAETSECCRMTDNCYHKHLAVVTISLKVTSPTHMTLLMQEDEKVEMSKLQYFDYSGEKFYVCIQYLENSEIMAIYVATGPTDIDYEAKMMIWDDYNQSQNISIIRDVIPLDEASIASSNHKALLAEKRCWFIPKCSLDSLLKIETDRYGVSKIYISVMLDIMKS